MKKIFLILFLSIIVVLLHGCFTAKESGSPAPAQDNTHVIITDHFGYDYSAQVATGNYEVSDGGILAWCPDSTTNATYADYSGYFWYSNFMTNSPNYTSMFKNCGPVELSSITSIPNTWDAIPLDPIVTNNCYVAKCHDGYVAFQVLAIGSANITEDTSDKFMPVKIKYKYTATNNF
ncbi:MAG: hypothetical protein DKM50_09580 [Candidatus Margulisiibacteriota bacterium]|nr:MAG: hypothetical protein A2X43_04995 [Candidatus Margulisbacteria bacterium GWD2_39_127]OGI02374.1 MAG: hypothetical protein A2X42_09475 [Candidatus Margulisbacteria bacterium GWF2_38_17]OGI08507.1 MAG: hypothetical protein A2X41_07265 [Candidatus Margulisbacteria bacterium GWE2_39_32]PZM79019.1 MAG: hypothetical protein DKM50_09580 [Candidatus Margulisiibacteriota bacterium]HAR64202.1 hypothetical protein [Candidatus Margulisiibacteriota bacterium]